MVDVPTASFKVFLRKMYQPCVTDPVSVTVVLYIATKSYAILRYITIGWKNSDVIIRNNKITLDTV